MRTRTGTVVLFVEKRREARMRMIRHTLYVPRERNLVWRAFQKKNLE